MLILVRRPGESVVIGNDVTVTVLNIRSNRACLGINAPRNVEVDRAEIRQRKLAEDHGRKTRK